MPFNLFLESESDSEVDACSSGSQTTATTNNVIFPPSGRNPSETRYPCYGSCEKPRRDNTSDKNRPSVPGATETSGKLSGKKCCKCFCGAVVALTLVISLVTLSYCVPAMAKLKAQSGSFNQTDELFDEIQGLTEKVASLKRENEQLKSAVDRNAGEIRQNSRNIETNENHIAQIERKLDGGAAKDQVHRTLLVICVAAAVFYREHAD